MEGTSGIRKLPFYLNIKDTFENSGKRVKDNRFPESPHETEAHGSERAR